MPQIFKGTIISFFLFSLGANKNIVYLCGLKLSWPCAGGKGWGGGCVLSLGKRKLGERPPFASTDRPPQRAGRVREGGLG